MQSTSFIGRVRQWWCCENVPYYVFLCWTFDRYEYVFVLMVFFAREYRRRTSKFVLIEYRATHNASRCLEKVPGIGILSPPGNIYFTIHPRRGKLQPDHDVTKEPFAKQCYGPCCTLQRMIKDQESTKQCQSRVLACKLFCLIYT